MNLRRHLWTQFGIFCQWDVMISICQSEFIAFVNSLALLRNATTNYPIESKFQSTWATMNEILALKLVVKSHLISSKSEMYCVRYLPRASLFGFFSLSNICITFEKIVVCKYVRRSKNWKLTICTTFWTLFGVFFLFTNVYNF